MFRLFIAIELPPQVQSALHTAQAGLKEYALPVRWVDPAGAHLTLKFLGATRPDQVPAITAALDEVARAHRQFELVTADLGCFPNLRAPRVIWMGLAGALQELTRLRDDIEQPIAPLGFPTEKRPFNPHLTLGRTSKDASRAAVAGIGPAVLSVHAPPPVPWQIHDISLMRSELGPSGARYTCLEQAHLDKA
jgi:2'-5' RNA ligase